MDIAGKPMIQHVYEQVKKELEYVLVATDDERISEVVENAGFQSLLTSANALTGTDRLAEAARQVSYDLYVNVQGDEPLVDPADIQRCIEEKKKYPDRVINGFCWMSALEDPHSPNIPKVVATEDGALIYMSRCAVPGFKDAVNAPERYRKQVCIYGFGLEDLEMFKDFGRKSEAERSEDIEILRFLELDRKIQLFETTPGSLAVDVPSDVPGVEAALRNKLCLTNDR